MTLQEVITAPVEQIAFDDLYVSDLNPRSMVSEAGIEALAENIRQLGLIQNLAGLRNDAGKVGIVAGGRRLRALALLQDDPRFATVTVKIAPDQATAEVWAASENHHREQPHPAEEIREYGAMAAKGVPVPSIAVAFGVSEGQVYRRLKLAGLPEAVLDALAADEITLAGAAAFTVSEDGAHMAAVLEQVRGAGYGEQRIKQMLKPDAVRESDRRAVYVGLEAYREAGGRVTHDLFAEALYLEDVAILDEVFVAKLDAAAEAMRAAGWHWAEALPESRWLGYYEIEERKLDRLTREEGVLSEAEAERYDVLSELADGEAIDEAGLEELQGLQAVLDGQWSEAQKAVSGALLYVNQAGELQATEGLVRKADIAAAIAAGVLHSPAHASDGAPKSPISAKLRSDLDRIALGARQHAALREPDLLIDLLAYQLSHALRWNDPLGIATTEVENWPSTEGEGYALDARLTSNPPRDMWDAKDLAKSFRAFRAKGQEHVRGELTRFLAAQYRGGDETLKALLDKETQPAIREVWTPNAANFFARVAGPYLNDLWRDLLDLAEDHPTATTFAKLKKGEKAAKLEALFAGDADLRKAHGITDAQAARIDAWLPEGMG